MDEQELLPTFKAAKRRKIVQTRPRPQDNEVHHLEPEHGNSDDQRHLEPGATHATASQAQLARLKKRGIVFSSHSQRAVADSSMVPTASLPIERPDMHNDKFVRSTGKAINTENMHMAAFIDAKLAEVNTSSSHAHKNVPEVDTSDSEESIALEVSTALPSDSKDKLQAIPRTKRVPRRTRRRPAPPTQADISRNSMVDQLMQESAVSMYDKSEHDLYSKIEDDDQDKDTAAAAAFKAEFLAKIEDKRYTRKPANSNTVSSGPRLGGGRMVQKMRAADEQAKAK